MYLFRYNGPVMEFDRCVVHNWQASTYADTKKKAANNLKYQFKKYNNRVAKTKISLDESKIEQIG